MGTVYLYRYTDSYDWNHRLSIPSVTITETRYIVIRHTKCGYVIDLDATNVIDESFKRKVEEKWVSGQAVNRFAFPTKEAALINYRHRKVRQINILEKKLAAAKKGLSLVKDFAEQPVKDAKAFLDTFNNG